MQWNTGRFWESLTARVAAFHLDPRRHGFVFSVESVDSEHYIGFNLDHLDNDIERLPVDYAIADRACRARRAGALEHYSPHAIARCFLDIVAVCDRSPDGAVCASC